MKWETSVMPRIYLPTYLSNEARHGKYGLPWLMLHWDELTGNFVQG